MEPLGPNDPNTAYPNGLAVTLAPSNGVARDALVIDASTGNPLMVFRSSEETIGQTHTTTGGDLWIAPGDVSDPYDSTTSVDLWAYQPGGGDAGAQFMSSSGANVYINTGQTQARLQITVPAGQTSKPLEVKSASGTLMHVTPAGDVEVDPVGAGVILKSPNGSRWRIAVSDAGAVSAVAAT